MGSEKVTWTLTSGDVVVEIVATLDGDTVDFDIQLVEGTADLNGLFLDFGNDGVDAGGKDHSKLGHGNNMKGSNSDGVKLDGFDFAAALGSVGGNDADYTSGHETFSLSELGISSFSELADAEIGIRATSVGPDREGSLKLSGTGVYDPGGDDPGGDYFPEWPQDISHVTLVFAQSEGDVKPSGGDGFYTVKIDDWPGGQDPQARDLDSSIEDIIAYLIANDEFIVDESTLVGVVVKGGNVAGSGYYAYGDYDSNGPDPDPLPPEIGFDLSGANGNENPSSAIDMPYYDYGDVFGF